MEQAIVQAEWKQLLFPSPPPTSLNKARHFPVEMKIVPMGTKIGRDRWRNAYRSIPNFLKKTPTIG
jgi:hypothetical protein